MSKSLSKFLTINQNCGYELRSKYIITSYDLNSGLTIDVFISHKDIIVEAGSGRDTITEMPLLRNLTFRFSFFELVRGIEELRLD